MAVYVDTARHNYRRMVMCHMWADTEEELLDMADKIGVARRWLQQPPHASWVHFDICRTKRALALEQGALVTDKYGPLEHVARLTGNSELLERVGNARRKAAGPQYSFEI